MNFGQQLWFFTLLLLWTEVFTVVVEGQRPPESGSEMNTTLEKQVADKFDRANDLMRQCADEVLDILRDNVTYSERIEPCDQKIIDEVGLIFKEARQYFNKEIKPDRNVMEPMNVVKKEIQLAEDQLNEGYGIIREMIKNSSTLVWPKT